MRLLQASPSEVQYIPFVSNPASPLDTAVALPGCCFLSAGKNYTAEQMAASLSEHVAAWQASHPLYHADRQLAPLAAAVAAAAAGQGPAVAATVKAVA